MDSKTPVTALTGIGDKTARLLKKLGIATLGDLLFHLPAYYRDLRFPIPIRNVQEGEEVLVSGKITVPPRWVSRRGNFSVFSFEVADGTGVMDVNIFNLGFLFEKYKAGQSYCFYGKPKLFRGRMQMDNPLVQPGIKPPGILGYYPLTAGIGQNLMRRAIAAALKQAKVENTYSHAFYEKAGILDDWEDFQKVHCPSDMGEGKTARDSMVYKELLVFGRMIDLMDKGEVRREPLAIPPDTMLRYVKKLPFSCTKAQVRVMGEILSDMLQDRPMNRLVEGDVGSGKTAVALFAAYAALCSGGQTILMAPTELLAEQHYAFAKKLFGDQAALLKGSTPKGERASIARGVTSGEIGLLISTHAVLYSDFTAPRLELIITDEQHRFGVGQRAALLRGNPAAHMLILTATPIPRTLSLILYGKAKVSVIDELPPGRKPVQTHIVGENKRLDMYRWIYKKLLEGDQAYVTCPLIEPNEGFSALSVTEAAKELTKLMRGQRVEMLHGKMGAEEKRQIMERFRAKETAVLVSTTVIEVGVDVPSASIMVVENADRFGLAQLHQLRGRVGRGDKESYCYLVSDGSGLERLQILKNSSNGFEIAEKDLELRGGGELIGQRQHGRESLQISNLVRDVDILLKTREMLKIMPAEFPEDFDKVTRLAMEKFSSGEAEVVLN